LAVKLRLKRMGKKKQPIYKVVAADARSPRDGRFIEAIGVYNPLTDPATVQINEERALYWLGVGAQPTDTVKNLLSKKGILLKNDLVKSGLPEEKIEARMLEWERLQEAKNASLRKSEEVKEEPKAEVATEEEAETEAKAEAENVSEETVEEQAENGDKNTEAEGTASEEEEVKN
jgi:small subunit ribosomal protein S16